MMMMLKMVIVNLVMMRLDEMMALDKWKSLAFIRKVNETLLLSFNIYTWIMGMYVITHNK